MEKNKVSDQSVKKATGKNWADWFAFIDQHNGKNLSHKEIVADLKAHSDLNSWWQQMVTVEYEIARGKRKPHEMPDGFQIGKSRTVSATIEMTFQA